MKTKLMLILMLAVSFNLFAQTGFQKLFQYNPVNPSNLVSAVNVCSNIEILVAGYNDSSLFIQKWNAAGTAVIWSYKIVLPITAWSKIHQVGELTQGEYYILGTRYITGTDYHTFLIRINNAGTVLWSKDYNFSVYPSYPYTRPQLHFNPGSGFVISVSAQFYMGLLKTDLSGNFIWGKTFEGDTNTQKNPGTCSTVLSNNDIISCGKSGNSLMVVKLNSSGTVLWSKVYSNSYYTKSHSVIQTSDGNILIAGMRDADGTLIKMDTSGTVLWQKIYTNLSFSYSSIIYFVKELSDGTIVMASSDSSDVPFIIVTDAQGTIIRTAVMNGYQLSGVINSIALTPGDDLLIGGSYYTTSAPYNRGGFLFKTDTLLNAGCNFQPCLITETPVNYSATVAPMQSVVPDGASSNLNASLVPYSFSWSDYCQLLSVEPGNLPGEAIDIFPVPVTSPDDLHIQFGKNKNDLSISIYDLSGKIVYEKTVFKNPGNENNTLTVKTAGFSKGIYIAKVSGNEMYLTRKIVIQ